MKIEIYSDIACPWCYIGKRRFENALVAFPGRDDVDVVFKPYQLDPAAVSNGAPLIERLQRKFGASAGAMAQRVTETARSEGLEMNFDRAIAANTLDAHRLLWLAEREYGPAIQHGLADRLFAAHFTDGIDIADRDALAAIAVSAGLDRTRVSAILAGDEATDEVRTAIRGAQELGITAVPTFIFDGRYAVQGGQPAPIFLQALEQVAAETIGTP